MTTETQERELERLRQQKQQRDEQTRKQYELKEYGVVTSERYSSNNSRKVTVIPVEIEVSGEVDEFIKCEILDEHEMTYPMWIQQCFNERMRQILTDPTEFGKAVLERKRGDHCISNVEEVL